MEPTENVTFMVVIIKHLNKQPVDHNYLHCQIFTRLQRSFLVWLQLTNTATSLETVEHCVPFLLTQHKIYHCVVVTMLNL